MVNAHGVMRVWQDVSGHRTQAGDYVVISSEARLIGDRLTMYLATSDRPVAVQVLDSRPTILEGLVRHELRLQPVPDHTSGPQHTGRDSGVETK